MEITEINDDVLKKIIKCQEGEFIFATYDMSKDPELTSDTIQALINFCEETQCKCLLLPEKNEQVSVALQDFDAESLRRLDGLIREALTKKSKIILN